MNGRKWIFISSLLSSGILTVVRSWFLSFSGLGGKGTLSDGRYHTKFCFCRHSHFSPRQGLYSCSRLGNRISRRKRPWISFAMDVQARASFAVLISVHRLCLTLVDKPQTPGEWVTPGDMRPRKGLRSQGHPKARQLCHIQGPACWVSLWSFLKNTASAKDSFQGPSCQTEQPTEALGLGLVIEY